MLECYSMAAGRSVMLARVEAGQLGAKAIDTEHLLMGIVRLDPMALQLAGASIGLVWARERATIFHAPGKKLPNSADMPMTDDAQRALFNAVALAETHKCAFVRTEHLLLALMSDGSCHAAEMLEETGASMELLEQRVANLYGNEQQEGAPLSEDDFS